MIVESRGQRDNFTFPSVFEDKNKAIAKKTKMKTEKMTLIKNTLKESSLIRAKTDRTRREKYMIKVKILTMLGTRYLIDLIMKKAGEREMDTSIITMKME